MKISTRNKIMIKALELFNKRGYASVTLFEIAGAMNITRGNLTYHFKNKDHLLQALSDEFWSKLEDKSQQSRRLPSFENLHNQIQTFYVMQKKYAFLFLDSLVLKHPVVRKKIREVTSENIRECEATIAFAISAENMHPEPYEGVYRNLAFNTWMISFFWLNQQIIRGEKTDKTSDEGEMKIWSMLLPHLTSKGLKAFRNFFGEDYLKNMGKSMNANIEEYLKF